MLKLCYFWIDLGLVMGFISLVYNIIWKYIPKKSPHEKEEKPV